MTSQSHEFFMKLAFEQAHLAELRGEVPVGAVIVLDGQIISARGNAKESSASPTHHAELLAIGEAALKLKRWRLSDCDLYVTLEPCLMCAGAIVQARLRRVIFGTPDPKAGAVVSLYNCLSDTRLNHRPEVISGILAAECSQQLKDFFAARRAKD